MSSISSGMDEDDDSESFYDAPDDLDLPIIPNSGSNGSILRNSDTLTNSEQFSTCKGDTLKTIADQNYARNSQRLEYDDEQRSLLHNFDDSVSSGNRAENEEEEESDWTNDRDEEFGDEPRSRSSSLAAKEKKHCSDRTLTSDRGSCDNAMGGGIGLLHIRHSINKEFTASDVISSEIPSSSPQSSNLSSNLDTGGHGHGARRGRRIDHLSLDNLSAVPALTSDSGTSFTPSSDHHDFLEIPFDSRAHGKSNSLPSSDGRRVGEDGGGQKSVGAAAASPCDFFKTLDRYYAPTEDSGSDHSGSTNTTQETKNVKKGGIKATPRKIFTKLKRRGATTKSRDSAFLEGSGSFTSGGADAESRTTVSDCNVNPFIHIPAYHSDNYPEARDKNFSRSTTVVQSMQSHQHNLAIWCLKFSTCGKYLAAAGQDKIIRVWVLRCEFETLNVLNTSKSSAANVHNLSYASQRSLEGSIKANSLKNEDSISEQPLNTSPFLPDPYRTFSKHSSDVMDISWSTQNSSYLLSASMDKSVRLWHIHMNKCLGAFDHQNIVTCVSFPPKDLKNNVFLSGAMDGKVRIWSITEKKVLNFYEASGGKKQPITCICFNNAGEYILVGTLSGQVLKLDSLQLRLISQTRVLTSKSGKLRRSSVKIVSIQESPRFPETFLVSSSDCRIRLYEAATSTAVNSVSSGATAERSSSQSNSSSGAGFWRLKAKYKGHSNKNSPIRTGFSRLGNFVVSGSECKGIFIWNTEPLDSKAKNTIFECLQAHEVSVTAATFSPTVEAIECLDNCQRKQQQQHHKSSSSIGSVNCSTTNFSSCSNSVNSIASSKCLNLNSSSQNANTPGTPGLTLGKLPEGQLDSQFLVLGSGSPDICNHGRTMEADDDVLSDLGAKSKLPVAPPPAVVINESSGNLNLDMDPYCSEVSENIGAGGGGISNSRKLNSASPAFTVKSLVVGEVFASADYTGKINVYFS